MAKAETQHTLFPILNQPLTGLAALAERATNEADGHGVEFKLLKVRSLLNRTVSKRRLSLAYSINPYRGCEFACRYCYARYTHTFFAGSLHEPSRFNDPALFEQLIFLKDNAAWLLEQELRRIDPTEEIAIGTATDPYQPIERKALLTQSILRVFARRTGLRIGIVTKSNLILRDTDLLAEISRRNTLVVHLTVTSPNPALARILEPRAPRPDLRLQAVRHLRSNGITAGVLCSPLLPGITDSAEQIDRMANLAKAAGASFFAAEPLFLKSCSRPTFLSFVREHFPHLVPDYTERFRDRDFAEPAYRDELQHQVSLACRRHGLRHRSTDALLTRNPGQPRPPANHIASIQQRLFA